MIGRRVPAARRTRLRACRRRAEYGFAARPRCGKLALEHCARRWVPAFRKKQCGNSDSGALGDSIQSPNGLAWRAYA
jgi:hypothetical protein